MENSTTLSPESLTAVEILESISVIHRDQAEKWEGLFSMHPEPMKKMAKQALKEHREGKSRELK